MLARGHSNRRAVANHQARCRPSLVVTWTKHELEGVVGRVGELTESATEHAPNMALHPTGAIATVSASG